jgi:hypothetical protein
MAELFLSYAHQDIRSAETLAELLEANGLTVWWDRRMVPGDRINDVIDEQLEKAKAVIVLWSQTSVKSDWVRGEAQTAQDLTKLVPIKIEECKLPINYRGIHTPEVYKKNELPKLAQLLTDKFKTSQPTQRTKRGPTAKIEFTDNSASNFFAKLATQQVQYEKDSRVASGLGTFRLLKKNPLGAAAHIAWVVLIFATMSALIFGGAVLTKTFDLNGGVYAIALLLVGLGGVGCIIWLSNRWKSRYSK